MEGLTQSIQSEEEKPLHSCELIITEEIFDEAFPYTFDKGKQKQLTVCGILVLLAGLIALITQFVFHKMVIIGFPLSFMGIMVIYWSISIPKRKQKAKFMAMQKKEEGNPIYRKMDLYEDHISILSNHNDPVSISFKDLTRIERSKNLVILFTKAKTAVMLPRDDYTNSLFLSLPREV